MDCEDATAGRYDTGPVRGLRFGVPEGWSGGAGQRGGVGLTEGSALIEDRGAVLEDSLGSSGVPAAEAGQWQDSVTGNVDRELAKRAVDLATGNVAGDVDRRQNRGHVFLSNEKF